MYWAIVVILVLLGMFTGFMVGVAFGQEHWHEK
jgi:hypothetical protein